MYYTTNGKRVYTLKVRDTNYSHSESLNSFNLRGYFDSPVESLNATLVARSSQGCSRSLYTACVIHIPFDYIH